MTCTRRTSRSRSVPREVRNGATSGRRSRTQLDRTRSSSREDEPAVPRDRLGPVAVGERAPDGVADGLTPFARAVRAALTERGRCPRDPGSGGSRSTRPCRPPARPSPSAPEDDDAVAGRRSADVSRRRPDRAVGGEVPAHEHAVALLAGVQAVSQRAVEVVVVRDDRRAELDEVEVAAFPRTSGSTVHWISGDAARERPASAGTASARSRPTGPGRAGATPVMCEWRGARTPSRPKKPKRDADEVARRCRRRRRSRPRARVHAAGSWAPSAHRRPRCARSAPSTASSSEGLERADDDAGPCRAAPRAASAAWSRRSGRDRGRLELRAGHLPMVPRATGRAWSVHTSSGGASFGFASEIASDAEASRIGTACASRRPAPRPRLRRRTSPTCSRRSGRSSRSSRRRRRRRRARRARTSWTSSAPSVARSSRRARRGRRARAPALALRRRPRVLLVGHLDTVWPLGTLARWPFAHANERRDRTGRARHEGRRRSSCSSLCRRSTTSTASPSCSRPTRRSARRRRGRSSTRPPPGSTPPSSWSRALTARSRRSARAYPCSASPSRAERRTQVSRPHPGANAAVELAHQLLAVAELERPGEGTTVTPSLVSAGTATNTVPAEATVHVDVRTRTAAEADRVGARSMRSSASCPGHRRGRGDGDRSAPRASASAELYLRAQRLASALGLAPLTEASVGGGSDGNRIARLGVPTLDGLGAVGDHAHAEGEFVQVGAMVGARGARRGANGGDPRLSHCPPH